jgi:hypothetical protein
MSTPHCGAAECSGTPHRMLVRTISPVNVLQMMMVHKGHMNT